MVPAGIRYSASETLFEGLADVLWKDVDEGWVRYDPQAGATLLLAPVTRFVLDQLSVPGRQRSEDELIHAICQEEPDAAPEDCRQLVVAALDALIGARLIQAAPSHSLENS
ncbi:MAG: hypothetical protein JSS57_06965 [Proteobacteria bacterium]|nr:hypothetical protein [Pseudomonadota bacterium]